MSKLLPLLVIITFHEHRTVKEEKSEGRTDRRMGGPLSSHITRPVVATVTIFDPSVSPTFSTLLTHRVGRMKDRRATREEEWKKRSELIMRKIFD